MARGTHYQRAIPRDLFNEAKLLKCLGQLSLLLHDEVGIRWPLELVHTHPEYGFVIGQHPGDGSLFCDNLTLKLGKQIITLTTVPNSKSPYPLLYAADTWGEGYVFADSGQLGEDFKDWLDPPRLTYTQPLGVTCLLQRPS